MRLSVRFFERRAKSLRKALEAPLSLLLHSLIFTSCPLKFHYEHMHCIEVLHYFLQNERKHK
jgi:hypothetical protein